MYLQSLREQSEQKLQKLKILVRVWCKINKLIDLLYAITS